MTDWQRDTLALLALIIAIVVGAMLILSSGCGYVPHLYEWLEAMDDIEELEPEAEPTPVPEAPTHHQPSDVLWHGEVTNATVAPGLILCTENYVKRYVGGRGRGGCVAFISATFTGAESKTVTYEHLEPKNVLKPITQPYSYCPNGAYNWITWGDHGPGDAKWYTYLTAYKEKEPRADGSSMGYIWIPYTGPRPSGPHTISYSWRSSSNRSSRAYLCLVYQVGERRYMQIKRHNQRGDGSNYSVALWDGVEFVKGGE